jgi:peptide methionine sulfoxide reductase msrA/msrB
MQSASSAETEFDKATFTGGCFWCMEPPYEKLKGVKEVITGYTGGHTKNPTYEEVSSGSTGHAEAIQVVYDPSEISYEELLDVFWKQINPTDSEGQFVDRDSQYRTVIYYHNEEQKRLAEKSKEDLMQSGRYNKPIVTEILPAVHFYMAEQYHQDFYINHSNRYKHYRFNSGRDNYLDKIWNNDEKKGTSDNASTKYRKPTKEELMKVLTPLQFYKSN